jgi:hypothetical protein
MPAALYGIQIRTGGAKLVPHFHHVVVVELIQLGNQSG